MGFICVLWHNGLHWILEGDWPLKCVALNRAKDGVVMTVTIKGTQKNGYVQLSQAALWPHGSLEKMCLCDDIDVMLSIYQMN